MAALSLTGCVHQCTAECDCNSNSFVHFVLEVPLDWGSSLLTDRDVV